MGIFAGVQRAPIPRRVAKACMGYSFDTFDKMLSISYPKQSCVESDPSPSLFRMTNRCPGTIVVEVKSSCTGLSI